MSEEVVNQPENQSKPKRKYTRHRPIQPQIATNPNIALLESDLVPFVRRRMELSSLVAAAKSRANAANMALQQLQNELAQVESSIQYQQQIIAQMKGVPYNPPQQFNPPPAYPSQSAPPRFADYPQPPSPMYNPAIPYPTMPAPMEGVGSYPAQNRGLHRDANDPRLNLENDPELTANGASAEDVRAWEKQRGS